MVAPVAIAVGKKAAPVARKAAENPAGSIFLVVLAGAVLIQGFKNLPSLFPKLPGVGVVTAPFKWTKEAIEITAAYNDEVITGFEQIGPEQDPLENFLFGTFIGPKQAPSESQSFGSFEGAGPGELEEPGDWQKAYRGARTGLFTGLFNRGWFY